MSGYAVILVYVLAVAGVAAWFIWVRPAVLMHDPAYSRAVWLLDRCRGMEDMRTVSMRGPSGFVPGPTTWKERMPAGHVETVMAQADRLRDETLSIRRELAEIIMQAGHAGLWRRYEIMRVVGLIESASSPDFLIDYQYRDQKGGRRIRIPAAAVYLDAD